MFREHKVDVQVLEVGLGGRLDAVNIIDADLTIITSIGLDHMDWLGMIADSSQWKRRGGTTRPSLRRGGARSARFTAPQA